jgi:nucleoside-diphosphate-sugar epimerase
MRVFVTGATGFIGFAVVQELIAAGHQVTGLARSAASGRKLESAGARMQIGAIEDLSCLRRAVTAADGVIHTAFYHKISHMPVSTRLRVFLGGSPSRIVARFFEEAAAADRRAIETIAASLPQKGSPLVATFGTLSMKAGSLATEDDAWDLGSKSHGLARAGTQDTLKQWAARGIRTSAIRLPPFVHGIANAGFVCSRLIRTARKKKESAYVGDGLNRWPAVHCLDAARLFRLALENGAAGGTYHGVAEEGIPFRDIATVIGQRLDVPVVSKSAAEAAKHFGLFAPIFTPIDNPISSTLTQERLDWKPTQAGLLADIEQTDFSNV